MQYNLHNGLCDLPSFSPNAGRVLGARRLVANQHPDILVLNEAVCWYEPDIHHPCGLDYGTLFGYDHLALSEWHPSGLGNAILSRYPLEQLGTYSLGTRNGLRVAIHLDARRSLTLDAVHCEPLMPESLKETQLVCAVQGATRPYVLAGTINSFSSADCIAYDKDLLIQGYERLLGSRAAAATYIDDMFHSSTIQALRSCGLKDASFFAERRWTATTNFFPESDSRTSARRRRVDYLLYSEGISLLSSEVLTHLDVHAVSNHYPSVWWLEIQASS